MLLPHDEFAFAELKSEGKEQKLRLVFAMHEVLVRGHSLRRIETAMQRSELSLLAFLSVIKRCDSTSFRTVAKLHQGRLNIAFCDGHTEPIRMESLFYDTSDAALRRWNFYHEPHRERSR